MRKKELLELKEYLENIPKGQLEPNEISQIIELAKANSKVKNILFDYEDHFIYSKAKILAFSLILLISF